MANVYEFIISMKDGFSTTVGKATSHLDTIKNNAEKVSESLNKARGKVSELFSKMASSAVTAVKGPKVLKSSVDELKKKLEEVNKVRFSTHLKKEFDAATQQARKLEKQISRLEQGISGKGIGSKIAGWRKDFMSSIPGAEIMNNPITAAGAAVGVFWSATQKAMDAGKEKMKLQVLTGSRDIGAALYDGLTQFATDTVFGTEVYDMANQMLANGIKSGDVMPLMKQLGDIAMGDKDKLGRLSLALAQVRGKGHLAGQELLQLVNAGFNPLQEISERTGESMSSLKDKMEKGEISFGDVRKAMDMATGEGGKFHKMLEQVANTPYGQLENLRGQFDQMMVKIGNVFIPIATKLMTFFSWIGEKLGPVLEPIVAVIGSLAVGILAVSAAQWLWNLAMAANPITWIIVGVIALIGLIVFLVSKISGWGEVWKAVVNNSKLSWETFTAMVESLWEKTVGNIMIGINKIKEGWYSFKNAIGAGDKAENNSMLSQIKEDTDKRKKAIEAAEKAFKNSKDAYNKGYVKDPLGKLKWNKESSLSDTTSKLKNIIMPTDNYLNDVAEGEGGGEKKGKKKAKSASDSIVSGGSKQTNITINIDKVGTDTKIYVSSQEEGLSSLGERIREELLRAVNSVNQLQTG